MKITKAQEEQLHKLAFAGVPNSTIAAEMGIPLTEVHAHRSRLGITRDKVAQATGKPAINPDFEAAVQQIIVKPTFENAAAEVDKAAEPKSCRTCAHWACFAAGSDCTAKNCRNYVSKENRRKGYLFDRKREFICAISRADIGALSAERVQEIKEYLDQFIPDEWRDRNG